MVMKCKRYLAALCLSLVVASGICPVMKVQASEKTMLNGVDYEDVFDAAYYASRYADAAAVAGNNEALLFQHFVAVGMPQGRSGNSSFDVNVYMKYNPELVDALGINNLSLYYQHYVMCGKKEGRIAALMTVNDDEIQRQSVYNKIIALKSEYPEGMYWTNDNVYMWQGGLYYCGYGCAAFAFRLSDAAFGNAKARIHTDYSNIRVGDILRIGHDTHSVIVLEVHDNDVIVAEGNYNNCVHWGRCIAKSQLQGEGNYIMTRYAQ